MCCPSPSCLWSLISLALSVATQQASWALAVVLGVAGMAGGVAATSQSSVQASRAQSAAQVRSAPAMALTALPAAATSPTSDLVTSDLAATVDRVATISEIGPDDVAVTVASVQDWESATAANGVNTIRGLSVTVPAVR